MKDQKIDGDSVSTQNSTPTKESEPEPENTFDCMFHYRQRSFWDFWKFSWATPLIKHANENQLKIEDLGKIPIEDSNAHYTTVMQERWDQEEEKPRFYLLKCILALFKWRIFFACVATWSVVLIEVVNFHVLQELLEYLSGEQNDTTWAVICVLLIAVIEFVGRGFHKMSDTVQLRCASRMVASLQGMIYSKIFKMSGSTNKRFRKGEMQSILNGDAHQISSIVWQAPHISSLPALAFACFYSLYKVVGHIVWLSVSSLLICIVLCYFIIKIVCDMNEKRRKQDNKNSNLLNEIIEHIKVIKMNSYIQCFNDKLNEIKKKQYYHDFMDRIMWMPNHLTHHFTYWFMVIGTFLLCISTYQMTLTMPAAICIWRCIGKIKWHTGHLSHFASQISEFITSVKRIEDFLQTDNLETETMQRTQNYDAEYSVEIRKSNFFWGFDVEDSDDEGEKKKNETEETEDKNEEKSPNSRKASEDSTSTSFEEAKDDKKTNDLTAKMVLQDVELKIKKNEFVAVIGDVGAGKSSLIYSLLAETLFIDDEVLEKYGDVEIKPQKKDEDDPIVKDIVELRKSKVHADCPVIKLDGSVSLVEQKPFIVSQTIRENILFGEELDEDRYNKTIEICQLERDLEILEGGDLTQIGEKGVNLSGGQKARLSIARAVYANKDIVLMDDPLSALDAHVKRSIFDEVC
jgi:ABC-type multidrug transport system fused ATPase/permease subunit